MKPTCNLVVVVLIRPWLWNTMPTAPNPEGPKFRRGQRQQFSSILAMPVCAERDTECLLILSICAYGRHYYETPIGNVTSPQSVIFPVTYEFTTGLSQLHPLQSRFLQPSGLGGPLAEGQNFQANLFAQSVITSLGLLPNQRIRWRSSRAFLTTSSVLFFIHEVIAGS